ncbi:sec14 cytosolic factor [Lentinula edodes]|uniref:Sec14 cytosolic factor n=1 Tax=Lentinula edodes TaxID=5353 RepID=A0A1Q3DY95_LENED|nr:sec14 cytosolic factor [Lentinula edodes]
MPSSSTRATHKPEQDGPLLAIGKQCSHPTCHLVDFLPFKCQHCQESFCQDHYKVAEHSCPNYDESKHNRIAPNCPLCNEPVAIRPGTDPNPRSPRRSVRRENAERSYLLQYTVINVGSPFVLRIDFPVTMHVTRHILRAQVHLPMLTRSRSTSKLLLMRPLQPLARLRRRCLQTQMLQWPLPLKFQFRPPNRFPQCLIHFPKLTDGRN